MIVCNACGTQNADNESFCGECGAYLEWEGQRVAPEPEPQQEAAPAAADAQGPGFVQRVKEAVGLGARGEDEAAAGGAAPAPGAAGPPQGAASGPPPLGGAPAPPPAGSGTAPAPGPASSLVVPLAPAPPGSPSPASSSPGERTTAPPAAGPPGQQPTAAQQPAPQSPGAGPVRPGAPVRAVRPGAAPPRPRRRDLPPEDRPPAPGETICGYCGAGNAPNRKFCRRCGTDLADAPVARKAPWWKRMFSREPKQAPVAGTRPKAAKPKRSHQGLYTILGVLVALVVIAVLTQSLWSPLYNKVVDRIAGTKVVHPVAARASDFAPGHPASNIDDGQPGVFWAPAPTRRVSGQSVTVTFSSPFRLVYLRVFNGASTELPLYLKKSSVHKIEVVLFRKGADKVTQTYTLSDNPGNQDLNVAVDDVTKVRVIIKSVYRASPHKLTALGELEFLARK